MKLTVLRLNHRIGRDKRITTHLFLAARAFGASCGVLSGEKDERVLSSVNKTSKEWGGDFSVVYEKNWKAFAKSFSGKIVHLTMYGLPVDDCADKIKNEDNVMVIVGGAKVPPEAYELADYNVSVTSQPHSEVSALAVFLDKIFEGKELKTRFKEAKKVITPMPSGKNLHSEK